MPPQQLVQAARLFVSALERDLADVEVRLQRGLGYDVARELRQDPASIDSAGVD